jgi:hypothetical protein
MEGSTFVFYFPGLDTFLQTFRAAEHDHYDSEAAIIGSAVAAQFGQPTALVLVPIHSAIRSLADYVCTNTKRLAAASDEQRRIARDWQAVYTALSSSPP